jgi:hypothetical protein
MNKKENPLGIKIGDIVETNFAYRKVSIKATITKITDRILTGCNPLIEYDPETEDPDRVKYNIPNACDISFVTKIITPSPYIIPKPIRNNIFVEHKNYGSMYERIGDIMITYYNVHRLIIRALASVKHNIDRPIDDDKFMKLWEKNKFIGRIDLPNIEEYLVAVNWKVFKKFVIANKSRILMTRKEMEESGKQYQKQMEDIYNWDY